VPGATIRVGPGIGGLRERAVSFKPVSRLGRSVDRGADKWVAKGNGAVERQKSFRLNRVRGRLWDPEMLGGTPQKSRITERFGGRQQQQAPRVGRKIGEPTAEAAFDPVRERQRRRQAEAAGELRWCQPARQLQKCKWVAAGLDDDPLENGVIKARRQHRFKKRTRVAMTKRLEGEVRQTSQAIHGLARCEDKHHSLSNQPPGDKAERSRRRAVEPLCVVDDPENRLPS